MSVYAIGDVQGCYDSLARLLEKISFDPGSDQLWFAGDLVSRGPKSLETLRLVRSLDAVTVLGNHDLHLLAIGAGKRKAKASYKLEKLLAAPDCGELLEWLRFRPLIHQDLTLGYTLVHAGIPPQWNIEKALEEAQLVENILRSADYSSLLENMYEHGPDSWSETLQHNARYRYIINSLTRMRYCTSQGQLDLEYKGKPGDQAAGFHPWFEIDSQNNKQMRLVFGHWSTLGIHKHNTVYCIDSGCVWGRQLSAIRLEQPSFAPVLTQIQCPDYQSPDKNTKL